MAHLDPSRRRFFGSKLMKRKVPRFETNEEAEEFLEQDLSDLDFSQFKPIDSDFRPKQKSDNQP
jgi:predicted DNA binding CopG/RHH family protein